MKLRYYEPIDENDEGPDAGNFSSEDVKWHRVTMNNLEVVMSRIPDRQTEMVQWVSKRDYDDAMEHGGAWWPWRDRETWPAWVRDRIPDEEGDPGDERMRKK